MAKRIEVTNQAHDGYRRAGIQFKKDKNTFASGDLTDTQLAAIEADPRLTLVEGTDTESDPTGAKTGGMAPNQSSDGLTTGFLAGLVEADGTVKALSEVEETELRTLAKDMDIEGHDTLAIDELVKAIQSEPIQVPAAETLRDAIAQLDPSNTDHFTSSNKPQCDALETLMGRPVKAAERDEAWAEYQAQQEAEA